MSSIAPKFFEPYPDAWAVLKQGIYTRGVLDSRIGDFTFCGFCWNASSACWEVFTRVPCCSINMVCTCCSKGPSFFSRVSTCACIVEIFEPFEVEATAALAPDMLPRRAVKDVPASGDDVATGLHADAA